MSLCIELKTNKEYTNDDIVKMIGNKDKYTVTIYADFDNRNSKDCMPEKQFVVFKILDTLTGILDNIERFLNNNEFGISYKNFNDDTEYCTLESNTNTVYIWVHSNIGDQVYRFVM